jgi:hypothetical protein
MRLPVIMIMLVCIAGAVRAQDLPSTEESVASIAVLKRQIDSIDAVVNAMPKPLAVANDITLRFRRSALNALFTAFASHRTDDIHLQLLPTRPMWSETKSLLGMTVVNTIDVDTGTVLVDIKRFECSAFAKNTVDILVEIEGTGMIAVSGRYAGVPLSAAPSLSLYLQDKVRFMITSAGADNILLKPEPHTFMLKTKMSVQFLQWSIPYYREIPVEAEGVIKSIVLPLSISSTLMFPAPWAQDASRRFEFVPRTVRLSHTSVWAQGETLEFRADIRFGQ